MLCSIDFAAQRLKTFTVNAKWQNFVGKLTDYKFSDSSKNIENLNNF